MQSPQDVLQSPSPLLPLALGSDSDSDSEDWFLEDGAGGKSELPPASFPISFVPVHVPSEPEPLQSSKLGADDLPLPGLRVVQRVRWVRIGFALFVLLTMLLGLGGCAAVVSVPWRKAVDVVPVTVVQQVIQTQTTATPTEAKTFQDNALSWAIRGKTGKLVLIDLNTQQLCGSLGCLYNGVWLKDNASPQLLLSAYFKPGVPKSVPLFEKATVERSDDMDVPCFAVNQVEGSTLRHSTLCFQRDRYEVTDSKVVPLEVNK